MIQLSTTLSTTKNDIIRIAEVFNANHTKNAVTGSTSRSANTTGLMNFVLEPSGIPSAQIRNTTNSTSPLIVQQKARPTPASNNTYTNTTAGISFSIPQNWTTDEGQNHANATRLTVVTVSPSIALDPSALMQVIVQKDTKPLTSYIDQYLRDQLNSKILSFFIDRLLENSATIFLSSYLYTC